MLANTEMTRVDLVPKSTWDALMTMDTGAIGDLVKKKTALLALANKSEELLALLDSSSDSTPAGT